MLQKSGLTVSVLMHQGRDIPPPTLRNILKQAHVPVDEFLNALP